MAIETTPVIPGYVTTMEFDANRNPIYIGVAVVGSAKSRATWQIRKVTYDGANNPTDIQFANGSLAFDQKWDDRVSLTYA